MAENPELISQFTAITGADDDRARFYLESSAWKLDVAMSRYYENETADPGIVETPPPQPASDSPPPPPPTTSSSNKSKASKSANTNFATLNTLTTSSDEEEEEGQAFYAGGSEHSGQQVLGPSKKKDFVTGMFQSVRKHGVELNEARGSGSRTFHGTGYKLGQTSDDSVTVPGTPRPESTPEVSLKLWKDGFSINDGPLRSYTDPSNAEFLQSIQHGEIPQELRQGTTEVYLSMEDHRMENFKTSQKALKPFSGTGYTLGNPAPPVIGGHRDEDKPVNEERAKKALNLDQSQPVTTLQIRLSDGSRLVQQFNHTHTVGQIRAFIIAARPQYELSPFNLLSGYPTKVLNDSDTLVEANLLNSAIMQKLI